MKSVCVARLIVAIKGQLENEVPASLTSTGFRPATSRLGQAFHVSGQLPATGTG